MRAGKTCTFTALKTSACPPADIRLNLQHSVLASSIYASCVIWQLVRASRTHRHAASRSPSRSSSNTGRRWHSHALGGPLPPWRSSAAHWPAGGGAAAADLAAAAAAAASWPSAAALLGCQSRSGCRCGSAARVSLRCPAAVVHRAARAAAAGSRAGGDGSARRRAAHWFCGLSRHRRWRGSAAGGIREALGWACTRAPLSSQYRYMQCRIARRQLRASTGGR